MSTLSLHNVYKIYENENVVVKNFNLEIEDGEFLIFVGPSGCGKSTTLRMIAGLEEISKGEFWMDGMLMNYVEPGERGLSMVFQNYALYPNMNVYNNMAYALKVRKVPKKEIDKKVREVAEILEISHLLDRYPQALSGGQKQRVAIGSSIVRNPKVFLMDEPLSNLDAKLRAQLRVELGKLHKRLGTTIIYVTHDQTEAMTLGTRIVVMEKGVIKQVDSPQTLYQFPDNKFVAGFIGSPSMNFFVAEVVYRNMSTILEKLNLNTSKGVVQFEASDEQAEVFQRNEYIQREVTLGIRPEDIYTDAEDIRKKHGTLGPAIKAKITAKEMLGVETMLYFEVQGNQCCARVSADDKTSIGEEVSLYFDMEKVHFFDIKSEDVLR